MRHKILGKLRNYAILSGTVAIYVFLAIVLQLLFKIPSLVATLISDVVICIVCAILYFKFQDESFSEHESFQSKSKISLKQGICYFFYFAYIMLALTLLFTWFNNHFADPNMDRRVSSITKTNFMFYMILSCVIAPIQEEFMNRLFLYNLMKTKSHWLVSAIVTSLVFGALHGTVGHLIFGSLFGLVLALAYERTKVWYVPIMGHMIYNIGLFSVNSNDIQALASENYVIVIIAISIVFTIAGEIVYIFGQKRSEQKS